MVLQREPFLLEFKEYKEVTVIEDFSQLATIALMTAGTLLLLFLVWVLIVRSRRARGFKSGEALEQIMDARLDEGERVATIISEQIEEHVKEILEAEGKMLDKEVDFATGSDGSLQIWIDGEVFNEVDEIPYEEVREAVSKAVEKFNQ
jgi:hypothetical protein